MKLLQITNNTDPDELCIEYMLGNLCNHKCSYCFPGSNEGDHPWPDVNLAIKNLSILFDHYKKHGKNKFVIYLIGGEPTLWKDLPKFCNYFKLHYNCRIDIATNGSRSLRWWDKNAKCFDSIQISVHREFGNIKHLSNVSDLLYSKNVYLSTNVLMDYKDFEYCKEIVETLKRSKKRFPIIVKTVSINGQTFYNNEQKKYLENRVKRYPNLFWYFKVSKDKQTKLKLKFDKTTKTTNDDWIILNNLNKFKGWSCNIGVDYIKIFQNGTIGTNCGQFIYGPYNLYDKNFVFNPIIHPTTCNQNICRCKSEISIAKKHKSN